MGTPLLRTYMGVKKIVYTRHPSIHGKVSMDVIRHNFLEPYQHYGAHIDFVHPYFVTFQKRKKITVTVSETRLNLTSTFIV